MRTSPQQRSLLHNQLEAYRAAIDVNIISSITDANRKIVYVNDNFKRFTKYSDEEILGKTHAFLNSGYHPASFVEEMWQTISSGKMWQGEIQTRAKDGSVNWVETVIIPTYDGSNKITSYLFLSVLINERKQAEEQREKYIGVLEKIAHVVAHDLRGPVCSILGLVNIFEKTYCKDPEVQQAKDYLVQAANKLDQITRELSVRIYAADLDMKGKVSE
jgi:PAS domain S-box-containing protein